MDIVYIVGTASRWQDNELRYSLRSVARHLHRFRKIWIVGHKPDFISGDIGHIPCPDKFQGNKNRNIYEKIKAAFEHPGVCKNIFVLHDDHFILKRLNVHELPVYQATFDLYQYLKLLPACEGYRIAVANTWTVLTQKKLPIKNYNIHGPAIYNKKLFLEIMGRFEWNVTYGYLIKSLYWNCLQQPAELLNELKVKTTYQVDHITELIAGRPFFSIGDEVVGNIGEILHGLFPDPSPWEICKETGQARIGSPANIY